MKDNESYIVNRVCVHTRLPHVPPRPFFWSTLHKGFVVAAMPVFGISGMEVLNPHAGEMYSEHYPRARCLLLGGQHDYTRMASTKYHANRVRVYN